MSIRYADAGDASLAYLAEGSGEHAVIFVPGIVSNLALESQVPTLARFHERMTRFSRFVRFDRRGTGLSDPGADPLTFREQARDLEVLRETVGFERFALIGYSHGSALAARYAAEHPERLSHLVIIGGIVCDARDPAQPQARPLMNWELVLEGLSDFAGSAVRIINRAAPSLEPNLRELGETLVKASVTPRSMRQLLEQMRESDLRELLPRIAVPTLVIHAKHDALIPVAHGRYLGAHVPGARYLEIDSDYHTFFLDPATTAVVLTAVEEFVTGSVVHTADRVMTTVLFTDIVDSTLAQRRMGDDAWRTLRKAFESNTRRLAEQFGGRVVEFTGDGAMAAFPAASQALRAARALANDARGLGVEIRAGVHAGEAYTVDEQLFGSCVTLAARVAATAGAGELFTTETVRDLVDGADFAFRELGGVELKGIGKRRLLALCERDEEGAE